MSSRRLAAALAVAIPSLAGAQDTRTVVEPRFPAACATLRAALVPVGDSTLAEADEGRLDTDRIQRALDGCGAGRAVVLAADGARRAFLSGALRLPTGVTLRVDSGVTLYASRDPRAFEVSPGSCGVLAGNGKGCRPLIAADRAPHAGVMGPGTIDGRGWACVLGKPYSWWALAQQARNQPVSQNNPRLVVASRSDDFTLYRLTLRNSPNFHVVYERGDGFTAWGVIIHTPQSLARNTDGINPSSARNVTITRSWINTGDDDIAIKAGSGGPAHHISILDNHFHRGHGVSIGSETNGGAHHVLVRGLTIDGADNGLRIKSNASRGGLVTDVTYADVCIRRTKRAIEMDTHYTASPETEGTLIPHFTNVALRNVHVVDATRVILQGYDAAHRLGIRLDGVTFGAPEQVKVEASHAEVAFGPGPVNLGTIAGEDVHVTGFAGDVAGDAATVAAARRTAAEAPARRCGPDAFPPAPLTGR